MRKTVALAALLAGCGASISSLELQKAIATKRNEALKEIAAVRDRELAAIDRLIAGGKKDEARKEAGAAKGRISEAGARALEALTARLGELQGQCGSDSIMIKICQDDSAGARAAVTNAVSEAKEALDKRIP